MHLQCASPGRLGWDVLLPQSPGCRGIESVTVLAMSVFWATVIGAVIGAAGAIAGGFGAAWWQTSRADDVAQKIRRAERREAALLALNGKLAELRNEVLHLRAQAGLHPESSGRASPGVAACVRLVLAAAGHDHAGVFFDPGPV